MNAIIHRDDIVCRCYMGRVYTDDERQHADDLATALQVKIARYFPEPPQDVRIRELRAIQDELENMGFRVTWSLTLDPSTLACTCEVKLWVPKEAH